MSIPQGTSTWVVASNAPATIKASATYLQDIGYPVWVCDGVADDVQIQAAIDGLSGGAGLLHLSKGNFYCTTSIKVTHRLIIEGEGRQNYGTVVSFTGCHGFERKSTSANQVVFRDLSISIDGNYTGIYAYNWLDTTLQGLYIVHTGAPGGVGIHFQSQSYMSKVYDCHIVGFAKGIKTTELANLVHFESLWIQGEAQSATAIGISLESGSVVTIEKGWFSNLLYGVQIPAGATASDITIRNSYFQARTAGGYDIDIGTSGTRDGIKVLDNWYDGGSDVTVTGTPDDAYTFLSHSRKYRHTLKSASATLNGTTEQGSVVVVGAVALVELTMPPEDGIDEEFYIFDYDGAQNITLRANTGDTIIGFATLTHTANKGDFVHLVKQDASRWMVYGQRGTWTSS